MENTLNERKKEIIANFYERVKGVGLIEAIRNTDENDLALILQNALESNKNLEDEIEEKQIMKIKTCEEYVLNELETTRKELNLAKNKIEELKKDNEQLYSFFQGTIEDLKKERDDLKERLDFFSKHIRHDTSFEGNEFFYFNGYIWQAWNEADYNKLCEWLNIEQEEKSNEQDSNRDV